MKKTEMFGEGLREMLRWAYDSGRTLNWTSWDEFEDIIEKHMVKRKNPKVRFSLCVEALGE